MDLIALVNKKNQL